MVARFSHVHGWCSKGKEKKKESSWVLESWKVLPQPKRIHPFGLEKACTQEVKKVRGGCNGHSLGVAACKIG